jgi:hypothetical protein
MHTVLGGSAITRGQRALRHQTAYTLVRDQTGYDPAGWADQI